MTQFLSRMLSLLFVIVVGAILTTVAWSFLTEGQTIFFSRNIGRAASPTHATPAESSAKPDPLAGQRALVASFERDLVTASEVRGLHVRQFHAYLAGKGLSASSLPSGLETRDAIVAEYIRMLNADDIGTFATTHQLDAARLELARSEGYWLELQRGVRQPEQGPIADLERQQQPKPTTKPADALIREALELGGKTTEAAAPVAPAPVSTLSQHDSSQSSSNTGWENDSPSAPHTQFQSNLPSPAPYEPRQPQASESVRRASQPRPFEVPAPPVNRSRNLYERRSTGNTAGLRQSLPAGTTTTAAQVLLHEGTSVQLPNGLVMTLIDDHDGRGCCLVNIVGMPYRMRLCMGQPVQLTNGLRTAVVQVTGVDLPGDTASFLIYGR